MELRNFGVTGIKLSVIGYGAGQIGERQLLEKDVEQLLNTVLDMGINLIDTARGYGASEERIGKHLAHRRNEYILSTKVGYGIDSCEDWTYECIIKGVEEALQRLKTDYIDILFLHSCSKEILKEEQVINALEKVQKDGKAKFIAYSGDNEDMEYAISTNKFQAIMSSANICDQKFIHEQLPIAKEKGLGVIAKRPIANAPWLYNDRPYGRYVDQYWLRFQAMNIQEKWDWLDVALRFCAFTYGIDCCTIGTTNVEHLERNVKIVNKGQLPQEIIDTLHTKFNENNQNWLGQT